MAASCNDTRARLQRGNARFTARCGRDIDPDIEQAPIAAVIGCADARVPVETVFDQPFGALFVVRVAGNVATRIEIASLEFAVANLGVDLLVCLGHSGCGAVTAAVDAHLSAVPAATPCLQELVSAIAPAVAGSARAHPEAGRDELIERAVAANVRAQLAVLRRESALIDDRVTRGTLHLAGARYVLATGEVAFFDD